MSDYSFRAGDAADSAIIFAFLTRLAAYEGRMASFKLAPAVLQDALAAKNIKSLLCEFAGKPVGVAMWCDRFSPYAGGTNLLLIDLYLEADHRHNGLGRRFMSELHDIAVQSGYARMEWFVDAENADAKTFYTKIGGRRIEHSEHWKLDLVDQGR